MKPNDLILKCFAEYDGESWSAICLDFTLAAQAETFEEAKNKLEVMIIEYVNDALSGEDRPYARQLLSRRAPLSLWLQYYWMRVKNKLCHQPITIFNETMPLRMA